MIQGHFAESGPR